MYCLRCFCSHDEFVPCLNSRAPLRRATELDDLDERDLMAGYWAGFGGDGHEPSAEFNRSYWHGWRNGMIDSKKMKGDATSAALARDVVQTGYLRRKLP